jgi:hypothetical protein
MGTDDSALAYRIQLFDYLGFLWAALLTIIDIFIHFRLHKWSLAWLVLGLTVWMGFAQTRTLSRNFRTVQEASLETETHGWLTPANDLTPPNSCNDHDVPITSAALTIIFGDGTAISTDRYSRNGKSLPVFELGGRPLLSIDATKDGLLIDADIFSPDGRLAARIKQNEFHLVSQEISYSEARDNDRSTLKIYDPEGNRMLYVKYANPTTVIIDGTFYAPGRATPLIVGEQGIDNGGYRYVSPCISGPFTNVIALFYFG